MKSCEKSSSSRIPEGGYPRRPRSSRRSRSRASSSAIWRKRSAFWKGPTGTNEARSTISFHILHVLFLFVQDNNGLLQAEGGSGGGGGDRGRRRRSEQEAATLVGGGGRQRRELRGRPQGSVCSSEDESLSFAFCFLCAFIADAFKATKLENEIRRGSTPRSTSESSRPPSSSGSKQQQQPQQPQQQQLTDATAVQQQQQQRPSSAARLLFRCSTNEGLVKFRKTFYSGLEAKPAAPRPEPTAPPPPRPPRPPRPAEAAPPPASAPARRRGRSAPTARRRSGETRTSGSITTRMRTRTRRSKWRTKLPSLQSRSA